MGLKPKFLTSLLLHRYLLFSLDATIECRGWTHDHMVSIGQPYELSHISLSLSLYQAYIRPTFNCWLFGYIKSNSGRKLLMFDLDSVWTFALVLILHAHEERFPLVLIFHYYSLFGCNQMWSFDQVKCAADIKNAKHLIFPGVGAFGTAMDSIRKQGYALLWKMYSTLTGMIAFILW